MLAIILTAILFVPMALVPVIRDCKQEEENKNTVDKSGDEVYSAYCKHFS